MDTVKPGVDEPARRRLGRSPLRAGIWVLHVSLPALGLWLLLAQPEADVRWEHHASHSVLVLGAAVLSGALGLLIADTARDNDDARIFLIGAAFLVAAAFFGAHALTTPAVLVDIANLGWTASTTVGLLLASGLALAASFDWPAGPQAWPLRHARAILGAVLTLAGAWTVLSVASVPPFDQPVTQEEARGRLTVLAVVACVAFLVAGVRFWMLHRRRPSATLVSVVTALVLLAEAAVASAVGRTWQLSWWLWHVLIVLAFAFVAYTTHVEYRRRGRLGGLFRGVALDATLQAVQAQYTEALEQLVDAMRGTTDRSTVAPLAHAVAQRFALTEDQRDVLQRAALALADERETTDRLDVLVALGKRASLELDDASFFAEAADALRPAFRPDDLTIALPSGGVLERPPLPPDTWELEAPVTVQGVVAGVVRLRRTGGALDDQDRALLASVGSLLGNQLENARLYSTIDSMFRRYVAPDVVTSLLADPSGAALGGSVAEVTTLFADLRGFTSFSETHPPEAVVELLNRYYTAAIPVILAQGGTVLGFAGDALMAVWNAPARQTDHAWRAAKAALGLHEAIADVAGDGAPLFRVGVNTGVALVGNIGSDERRDYTVIGDSVNLASRLESAAGPGEVLLGPRTRELLGDVVEVEVRGPLRVKGKEQPVPAYRLVRFR